MKRILITTLIPAGNDILSIFSKNLFSTRFLLGSIAIKKAGIPIVNVDTNVNCIGIKGYSNGNKIVIRVNNIENTVFVKNSVATL